MDQDYYKTLEVEKTASTDEIKRAYRKLAHKYHPDKFGGDETKFKEASEAYQVLSDAEKRKQYDQFGRTFDAQTPPGGGPGGTGGSWQDYGFDFGGGRRGAGGVEFDFSNLGDIFETFFGGGRGAARKRTRGEDIERQISLHFEVAVFGKEIEIDLNKKIPCSNCKGKGAEPGFKIIKCDKCDGSGKVREVRSTILGQFSTITTCDKCEGGGKIPEKACRSCKGSGTVTEKVTLKVKIPAGVDTGSVIRVPGGGDAGEKGTPPGDLYLHIDLKPHPTLKRLADDLVYSAEISFSQAALGGEIEIDNIRGREIIKIPAGIETGEEIRLKGKGIPHLNSYGSGDLIIKIKISTPKNLTSKQKELFKQLEETDL